MKKNDPVTDEAAAFYAENAKSMKKTVALGHKHDELQPEKWTEKVFNGDNTYTNALQAQQAAKRNE